MKVCYTEKRKGEIMKKIELGKTSLMVPDVAVGCMRISNMTEYEVSQFVDTALSNGANFSQRQKDSFRRLSRGKRFYISRVKAIGPDGIERDLAPMEVIVN